MPQESDKPAEPMLFPAGALPERPDVVEFAERGPAVYSGKIVGKDLELCSGVVTDLLLGVSGRDIAAKWHISRRTIVSCERVLRGRGELAPLAKKISDDFGELILLLADDIKSDIIAGRIHPNSKPLALGLFVDKKAALDSGVVPGTGRTIVELRAADVQAELAEQLRRLQSPDLESTAEMRKGQQIVDVQTVSKVQSNDPDPNAEPDVDQVNRVDAAQKGGRGVGVGPQPSPSLGSGENSPCPKEGFAE